MLLRSKVECVLVRWQQLHTFMLLRSKVECILVRWQQLHTLPEHGQVLVWRPTVHQPTERRSSAVGNWVALQSRQRMS